VGKKKKKKEKRTKKKKKQKKKKITLGASTRSHQEKAPDRKLRQQKQGLRPGAERRTQVVQKNGPQKKSPRPGQGGDQSEPGEQFRGNRGPENGKVGGKRRSRRGRGRQHSALSWRSSNWQINPSSISLKKGKMNSGKKEIGLATGRKRAAGGGGNCQTRGSRQKGGGEGARESRSCPAAGRPAKRVAGWSKARNGGWKTLAGNTERVCDKGLSGKGGKDPELFETGGGGGKAATKRGEFHSHVQKLSTGPKR